MFKHVRKTGDAAGGEGVDRAGADAVDANFLWAEVVGKITATGLEGGFGDAHDVVMRDDFFRAVISHGDDAAAVGHERGCRAGKSDEGISADVVSHAKGFAGGVHKLALERFLGGKSDGVEEQMDFAELLFGVGEEAGDVFVAGDIAWNDEDARAKGGG